MGQREFTVHWATDHFDNWQRLLGHLAGRPGLVALEVGCYEGRSACWWLENVLTEPSCRLYCVDPWPWTEPIEERFDRNIADTGRGEQVLKLRGPSRKMLAMIPDRSLDFAYVDGLHATIEVLRDALQVLPLLKPGGILIFDDYEWTDGPGTLPKPGIDTFLTLAADQIEELHRGWQIIVRKV